MTDQYKFAPWNKHQPEDMKGDKKGLKLTPRVHYRQVIEEAGYTLEQLAGTHELLSGARDVLYGMSFCFIRPIYLLNLTCSIT